MPKRVRQGARPAQAGLANSASVASHAGERGLAGTFGVASKGRGVFQSAITPSPVYLSMMPPVAWIARVMASR